MNGEKPVANWAPQLILLMAAGDCGLLAVTMPFSIRWQSGSKGVSLSVACSKPSK